MNEAFNIREWLASFPEDAARKRLAELEAEQQRIETELTGLRSWLDLVSRIVPSNQPPANAAATPNPEPEVVALAERGPARPSKRKAALGFLTQHAGEGYEFSDIRDAIIRTGRMGTADNEKHALRVALYKSVQRGEIVKRGKLYMVLPQREPLFEPTAPEAG